MASGKGKGEYYRPDSKQQTCCFHCGIEIRRDRLQKHTTDFHPGLPKKEKGEKSRSLLDMFRASSSRKRSRPQETEESSQGASESTSKKKKTGDEHEVSDDISDDDNDMEEVGPREAVKPGAEHEHAEPSVQLEPRKDSNNSDINDKLDKILEKLSTLNLSVPTNAASTVGLQSQSSVSDPVTDFEEVSAAKVLVTGSKSIKRLCEIAKLTADVEKNILKCDTCSTVGSRAGIFTYDFTLGCDFTASNQPGPFSNLKKSVSRHIGESTHQDNLIILEKESEQQRKFQAKQQSIGMTVGKQAYRLLKYCRPFSDFEVDIVLLSNANVPVGNLNHSRKFPSELRQTFAKVIDSRIVDYLAKPLEATNNIPPVGLTADKLTTRRRTGQMFAGILFTPGMPQLLTPISLGVEAVSKHDGEAISEDICKLCEKYKINPNQISGFGFDGQYFNLNVHTKLRTKLQMDERVAFVWDAAHLLQLADKDMRDNTEWIEAVCKDIGAILSKFSFGKNFEAALDMAHKLGIDLKAPLWFSQTRFAAYAHRVFQNFLDNYAAVRRVLEGIAASGTDKRAKEVDDLLRRIRTLDFILKVALCTDYYRVLSVVSKTLQQVDLPFWSKTKALEHYIELLGEMAKSEHERKAEHFIAFYKHKAELEQCMLAGLPLFVADVGLMIPLRGTRSRSTEAAEKSSRTDQDNGDKSKVDEIIAQIQRKGQVMFEEMQTRMNERFTVEYFEEMKDKAHSAALYPILSAARAANNEAAFTSSPEVVKLQSKHEVNSEGIRNLCANVYRHRDTLAECTSETELYHRVFSDARLYTGAGHVLNAIAKIYCSHPPESIVESMGSIIEQIKNVRGGSKTSTNKKDVKDISDELIVHWNGPHISKCDSVVRQTLNLHFKGRPWHFIAQDVRAKLHEVSAVVDRIKATKPSLTFML